MIKKEPALSNVPFSQHLVHNTGYHQVNNNTIPIFETYA